MAQYAGNLDVYLRVLYDYKYKGHDGSDVEIKCGDECLLIKKTTAEWWYVLKHGDKKPIYVPSNYVEEFHKTVIKVDSEEKSETKIKRAAPEVPKKKKIPPKAPPKPSKLIRKLSVEEDVLKELDSILERAFDGEAIAEENEDDDSDGGVDESYKRYSNNSSKTNSLNRNSDVFLRSKDTNDNNVTDSKRNSRVKSSGSDTTDKITQIVQEPEPDYDVTDIQSKSESKDDKMAASPLSLTSENAAADSGISEGSIEGLDKKHDNLEEDIPLDSNDQSDEEQPDYANIGTIQRTSKAEPDDDLPDYANLSEIQARIFAEPPPSEPSPGARPIRTQDEWQEHKDIATGRSYYFNTVARDSTWYPPSCFTKKRAIVPTQDVIGSKDTSVADLAATLQQQQQQPVVHVPRGWSEEKSDDVMYYVNEQTKEKWRSSMSASGKTYFYNEATGNSMWELPELEEDTFVEEERHDDVAELKHTSPVMRRRQTRAGSAPTLLVSEAEKDSISRPERSRIHSLHPVIKMKEMKGVLKRCKVMDLGKKVNKPWGECYAILFEGILRLYKNQKAAFPKTGNAKAESELELSGAILDIGAKDKKEKKKNVLSLRTAYESEFLLQLDTEDSRNEWHEAIMSNIFAKKDDMVEVSTFPRHSNESQSSLESGSSLGRKPKHNPANVVFGNHLHRVCDKDGCNIPRFVTRAIRAIEKRGLKTDGIYRVSGNMAEIQKLRLQIDSGSVYDLDSSEWEIHVLTGALKMFFRELKEPLVPFFFYSKFLQANQVEKSGRIKAFRDHIKVMPPSNRETLEELIIHLSNVTDESSSNRMQSHNVAIVFGPTLMWDQSNTMDMAASMQTGQVVEYILQEQSRLFL